MISVGDTFASLARRYGTTVEAIISANPLADPYRLRVGQVICVPRQPIYPACPEGNYYTIRPGDNLWAIAQFFGISLPDLQEGNPGINPYALFVGQVICIPVATRPVRRCPEGADRYVVRRGDTFAGIARRRNISIESLIRANPNINPEGLLIGQEICVPVGD